MLEKFLILIKKSFQRFKKLNKSKKVTHKENHTQTHHIQIDKKSKFWKKQRESTLYIWNNDKNLYLFLIKHKDNVIASLKLLQRIEMLNLKLYI